MTTKRDADRRSAEAYYPERPNVEPARFPPDGTGLCLLLCITGGTLLLVLAALVVGR